MPKVAVIGQSFIDLAVQCQSPPEFGRSVSGSGFTITPTGPAPNQAVQAHLCGCESSIISCIGNDSLGLLIRDNLLRFEVDTENLFIIEAMHTGSIVTLVDPKGENTSCITAGANNSLSPEHIASAQVEQTISTANCLVLDGRLNKDVLVTAIKTAQIHRIPTLLDIKLSSSQIASKIETLPSEFFMADFIVTEPDTDHPSDNKTVNFHESKLIAADLIARGVGCVIIRTTRRDCLGLCRQETQHVKAFLPDIVPISSGQDAFIGSLAASCAVGDSHPDALKFACAAQAIACKKVASQDNLPKKAEIIQLLQRSD